MRVSAAWRYAAWSNGVSVGSGTTSKAGPGGVLGAVHELEDLAHGLGVDRPGCDGHGDAPAVKVSVRGVYHRVVRTKDVIPGVAASELY